MLKDETWIASASPDKLVVRHRSGRLTSFLSFFFGSVFLAVAISEVGGMRWVAVAMAALNYLFAIMRSSVVTITFDRPAGEVECREQRLVTDKRATLPLRDFKGAEIRQGAGKSARTRLGLATRDGVFIPIEQTFSAGARTDIAQAIDHWLAGNEVDAPPPAQDGESGENDA